MNNIAIRVSNVSKQFKLPHQKTDSVKGVFIAPFKALSLGRGSVEVQPALKGVDLTIKKGEFFGIVGRNGGGKSTLLKLLAGIYVPSEGSVAVDGRLVPFIELGVGFNPELTGRENVYLSCALNGFSEKETDDMYEDIVSFAELEKFMDQKLKNYSSGMQVRLAFSVATRAKADILLIDEVLAVGDADFQRKCFDYFKSLKKQKVTVVFVSHDMNAVREYCDRVALIDETKLVAIGSAGDIATKYAQLFNRSANLAVDTFDQEKRWGNGDIKFTSVSINELVNDDTNEIELIMKAVAKYDIDNPLFGFTIKSPSGESVCGTNNSIIQQRVGALKAGQSITLSWKLPAFFSNGVHQVDATVESDMKALDWWEGATKFRCNKEKATPYITSPAVKLSTKISK